MSAVKCEVRYGTRLTSRSFQLSSVGQAAEVGRHGVRLREDLLPLLYFRRRHVFLASSIPTAATRTSAVLTYPAFARAHTLASVSLFLTCLYNITLAPPSREMARRYVALARRWLFLDMRMHGLQSLSSGIEQFGLQLAACNALSRGRGSTIRSL